MVAIIYGTVPNLPSINRSSTQKLSIKTFGLGDPMSKIGNSGGFARKVSNIELVKQNLTQLLLTRKGERVMLPNFGVSLRRFLFEPLDKKLFEQIRDDILGAIDNYGNNVKVLKIRIFPDNKIGFEGMNRLTIQLVIKLLDFQNQIIDLEVKI